MKPVLACRLGPVVGIIMYSIAVVVNSIIQVNIEPKIPSILLFIF